MINFIYENEAIIRLSVFLGGFSLLGFWEWLTPKRQLTQEKFKRWFNNILLVVTSTIIVRLIVPTAAISIAYLTEQNHWGIANALDLPFIVKVVFTFILLDLAIYIQHTIFHVLPVLWRFHRVHHSDLDCDVSTGLRFHPIEILLSILIKFIVITAIGAPVLAVIVFEVVLNLMSMFTHSNIRLNEKFERILRWFIVTPDMHRLHHSSRENETNSNFSFNISLWDRIFGTYIAKPHTSHQDIIIGLNRYREPEWQTLRGLITLPFNDKVHGYAINHRDTINTDEFAKVNKLVKERTSSLKTAKDIADQKNELLHETISRLAESESYQTILIENMLDGFISINDEGKIISFNPAAEKMFDYKKSEVIGSNIKILMSDSEATHHDYHLSQYKEKDEKHVIGISRDIEGKRKNGSLFPMDISISEVNIKGKNIYTAVVRDISDRKDAEAKILREKENAEKANQAKTDFLHSMSHELRSPLNAIIGFSELLSIQTDVDPEIHEQVTFIQQAGTELLDKVEGVLNLSNIQDGKTDLNLEVFSYHHLINECNDIVTPMLKKYGVELIIDISNASDQISTDRNSLEQILINLLSNAIKFNNEKGIVTVTSKDYSEKGLIITVKDNGPGIEQSLLSEIFEPFNRAGKDGANIPGTGIGLSIAKQLTDLLGGTLNAKSILGEGSEFEINLPNARN